MSGPHQIHRGGVPLTGVGGRRGGRVSARSIECFLLPKRPQGAVEKNPPVAPRRSAEVPKRELTQAAPLAEVVSIKPPMSRIAVVALAEAHFESTVALAVAMARHFATAAGSAGGIVTVDGTRVALAKAARRRSAVALRGFEPIGRSGPVTLIDAADAEPATIATAGLLPIACVIAAADGLGDELARLCPSALLLIADESVSDDYAALLAADLARAGCRLVPRVLRYGPSCDGVAIAADSSAAIRLRAGLGPGRRTAENAAAAIAALDNA